MMQNNLKKIDFQTFSKLFSEQVKVIDTRNHFEYLKGYINGSYSVDFEQKFDVWMKKLFKPDQKFIMMCDKNNEEKVINRLTELGYVNGLQGFFDWQDYAQQAKDSLQQHQVLSEEDFATLYNTPGFNGNILDVREKSERVEGYIEGAQQISVWELEEKLKENLDIINKDQTHYVHCRSGLRVVLAMGILNCYGIHNIVHIGGIQKLRVQQNLPVYFEEKKQ